MDCYSRLSRKDVMYFDGIKRKEEMVKSHVVAISILDKTCLKRLRCYNSVNLFYVFNQKANYYQKVTISEIELLVFTILTNALREPSVSPTYVSEIVATIKMHPLVSFFGHPTDDLQAIFLTAPTMVSFEFGNKGYDEEVNNYNPSKE